MPDFEVKATITLVGWDNVPAKNAQEAIDRVKKALEEQFSFDAPLLNMYSETVVEIDKGFDND